MIFITIFFFPFLFSVLPFPFFAAPNFYTPHNTKYVVIFFPFSFFLSSSFFFFFLSLVSDSDKPPPFYTPFCFFSPPESPFLSSSPPFLIILFRLFLFIPLLSPPDQLLQTFSLIFLSTLVSLTSPTRLNTHCQSRLSFRIRVRYHNTTDLHYIQHPYRRASLVLIL